MGGEKTDGLHSRSVFNKLDVVSLFSVCKTLNRYIPMVLSMVCYFTMIFPGSEKFRLCYGNYYYVCRPVASPTLLSLLLRSRCCLQIVCVLSSSCSGRELFASLFSTLRPPHLPYLLRYLPIPAFFCSRSAPWPSPYRTP